MWTRAPSIAAISQVGAAADERDETAGFIRVMAKPPGARKAPAGALIAHFSLIEKNARADQTVWYGLRFAMS